MKAFHSLAPLHPDHNLLVLHKPFRGVLLGPLVTLLPVTTIGLLNTLLTINVLYRNAANDLEIYDESFLF